MAPTLEKSGICPHSTKLVQYLTLFVGCDSSAGIVTRYGLDGTEIESRGATFSAPVQTGPGPNESHMQGLPGLSWR